MKTIHIVHLYAAELNIYGDTGNVMVLQKRLEWRGYLVKVTNVGVGEAIPDDVDLILGGGGQDASQARVEKDLLSRKLELGKLVDDGVVMLLICGTYQLFGRTFTLKDGTVLQGLGILPLETRAEEGRLIGNLLIKRGEHELIGYENHSGRTYLDKDAMPLGVVLSGKGNNDSGQFEGCEYKNVFGCYMHGPVLSKNPEFADELLTRIMRRRGFPELSVLDDSLEKDAREYAKKRPR